MLTGSNGKVVWRVIMTALRHESFRAVLLYRLSHLAYLNGWRVLSYYFGACLRKRFGTTIYATTRIEGGLRLPHPYGIIIGEGAVIGAMVTIGHHVTLGGNLGEKAPDGLQYPVIGNWSWITTGAVVAGPIHIGEDVIIGANAVVTHDIPDHAIAVGVPAKVLRIRPKPAETTGNLNFCQYFGFSPDDRREILK